ncbi:rhomboid domain-containing protein 2 [Odontesthes bonariensis]|uniref:rhomboid domain-containing protein 2 n=1 Tax=Odontesthes bonariensis TaxID=219752 RepID=UPI003F582D2D
MISTENLKKIFFVFKDVTPVLTSGVLGVVLLSCVVFGVHTYFNVTRGILSIGASVFQSGHVHRLFMYPFYHQTLAQLLLNVAAVLFLCGSVEKGVGTVRFVFLFLLLSSTTGLFYSFLDVLQDVGMQSQAEGLLPVTLACVALTTLHTKTTKAFLCGVNFPTIVLPWVLLIICTALIPHSVLPCNVIGILFGWMYGKGWFSLVEVSETRAGVLEKMMPFRLLRSISGGMFIPASAEERRKTLLPQINPTPGSYPVQAYAPVSSVNTADATAATYEGWPNVSSSLSSCAPPHNLHGHLSAQNFGHTHGHFTEQSFSHSCNHSHGQQQ